MHTYTEVVGFIKNVQAHLAKPENATALKAKQYPVDARKQALGDSLDAITGANADQEAAKVELKNATTALDKVLAEGYALASGIIDGMGDAYGKTSVEAKNVQKIRSAIRRGPEGQPNPGTPPA